MGRPVKLRHQERSCVELSVKMIETFTDSWINPAVTGLPSKRHRARGQSKGSDMKSSKVAREDSKKFEVAPELMSTEGCCERI